MTRKKNSDLTTVYNVRERTFFERVSLMVTVRDYVHSKLRPSDGASVSERPFSVYRHWVQANSNDPYFKTIGFCDLIPVLNRSYIGQAFAYSLHLKPFTDTDVIARQHRYDRRPWQIFQHYRFAGSDLFINIVRGCTTADPPAGWVADTGSQFELVLYLLLLGQLKFPRNNFRKRCVNPKYPSFNLSTACLNVLARAIQHVVRAWDDVARVLHIRSAEQLTEPYLLFERSAWTYRALGPHEGFAPEIQARSLADVKGPTQDKRISYPAVRSGRSTEAHAALRHLTELFLSDLHKFVLNDNLFANLGDNWQGEQLLQPSKKTSLSVRFDECVDILRHARSALHGENFETARKTWPQASSSAHIEEGGAYDEAEVHKDLSKLTRPRQRKIAPHAPSNDIRNGTLRDERQHSCAVPSQSRFKKMRWTREETTDIKGGNESNDALATPRLSCLGDDENGQVIARENVTCPDVERKEVIVIDDDEATAGRCWKVDYDRDVTLVHSIPVHLPATSAPPSAIVDVVARVTGRVGSLREAHDGGGPHRWPLEALHAVVHADAAWLLAIEGSTFGVYTAPSRVCPGSEGLFADRTFRPGDVVAPLHGALVYDCGKREARSVSLRFALATGNPAVDTVRFDNEALALPPVRAHWRVDNGAVVKRIFIVPSRACIGGKMVNLQSLPEETLPTISTTTSTTPNATTTTATISTVAPKPSTHTAQTGTMGTQYMTPNARVAVARRRSGILKKRQACATYAVKIVATKTIQVDDEICAKFLTGAHSFTFNPNDDSGSSDDD